MVKMGIFHTTPRTRTYAKGDLQKFGIRVFDMVSSSEQQALLNYNNKKNILSNPLIEVERNHYEEFNESHYQQQ